MDRETAMQQLKFLWDQVHQTEERSDHLEERMPLHVHAASLNYEKDLTRLQGEYNRVARTAWESGLLTADEIEREGLPFQFEHHKESRNPS